MICKKICEVLKRSQSMKKKNCIKDQREKEKNERAQRYRQSESVKKELLKREQESIEQAAKQAEVQKQLKQLNPVRERKLSTVNKSFSKAAGLKSTFVLNDHELLMTSFGRGNDAVLEKHIQDGRIENIAEVPSLDVAVQNPQTFTINGRIKGATTDNPLYSPEASPRDREDLIHARSALEMRYYGQTFEDNIHIQAIYNILDIDKILAVHTNNIVFTLNNFLRSDADDMVDLIGTLPTWSKYSDFIKKGKDDSRKWFIALCRAKQLRYLNIEVIPAAEPGQRPKKPGKPDPNTIKMSEEEFYNVLVALGTMRQMLAHGDPSKQSIYAFDGFGKNADVTAIIDRLYFERVSQLNAGFLEKAKTNLALLFKAFNVHSLEEKTEYVQDYYDFTVRKNYKNQGFSIRLLREHMTADIEEAYVIRDKIYDCVRGKLYPFIDFAIFRCYRNHPNDTEELVSKLRASLNETDKDAVYRDEAKRIWPALRELVLQHILPEMNGQAIKAVKPDPDVSADMLESVKISSSNATAFSKYIYMLTLFINGKEINDLLTTLIHKFENIASFSRIMKAHGYRSACVPQFKLFSLSDRVAEELRVINSFARMSKPSAAVKGELLREAMHILGVKAGESEIDRIADELMDPEAAPKGSAKRGLRNFIINNVIESDRFHYLVRYGNVNKLKGIAQNKAVVSFVLKEIPDTQIARYYSSITGNDTEYDESMRAFLADRITGFSFEDFSDVRQNDRYANQQEQAEKQQKQALVRIYLTVLYLTLKNLVYVNSRYFMAFHCLERDRILLNPDKWSAVKDKDKFEPEFEYSVFAREYLAKYPAKKRVGAYLQQNFSNSDDWAIRFYRNYTMHLTAILNASFYLSEIRQVASWFELYHYLIQRRLIAQFEYATSHQKKDGSLILTAAELNPKTLEYFSKVTKYGSCCRDFIKALNVPFAYNLPRYKNLSIDGLFDMNRPGKREETKNAALDEET